MHSLPLLLLLQVYELKKDEIDGALDKARAQVTALNDKYLSKVRGCQCGAWRLGCDVAQLNLWQTSCLEAFSQLL